MWAMALAFFLAAITNFALGMLLVSFHLFDLEFCRKQGDGDPLCLDKKEIGPLSWMEGVLMGFAAAMAIAAFLGFEKNWPSFASIAAMGVPLSLVMKNLMIKFHAVVIRIFFSDFKFI